MPNQPTGRLTILFAGMIAADPHQGGATWAVLQYLLGLRQLGHEVYFIEPVPRGKLRPEGTPLAASVNAAYFTSVIGQFGFAGRAALLLRGTREAYGMEYQEVQQIAGRADLLINVSGLCADPELTARIPRRVYLDLDPAFNQLWSAQGIDVGLDGHTHYVTVGQAIGSATCAIPSCGQTWITTLPPVVLNHWVAPTALRYDAFTTVGHWRSYGSVTHEGTFYGQKAHALRRIVELPLRTREQFLLAVAIDPAETADLERLAANEWQLLDPASVARTPNEYRTFVSGSKAEIGLTKSGYADSGCGWFSDRSVCYLAAGRPVLAQETGFSAFIPQGEGLVAFAGLEGAVAGVESIRCDYARHARAARTLAEEFFDSKKVLRSLLARLELSS